MAAAVSGKTRYCRFFHVLQGPVLMHSFFATSFRISENKDVRFIPYPRRKRLLPGLVMLAVLVAAPQFALWGQTSAASSTAKSRRTTPARPTAKKLSTAVNSDQQELTRRFEVARQ